ncbi:Variable large protein 18 (plasmid) [Borrelia turicatae]|uniref:Variable large protein n=1 Tax=Borrelia turicatae TaxID=142 RepID=A0A172XD74_BORTU|nr:variable large family protein [Borrelia turicatae]ANF34502.1 Variable large protein 18 [Borrelia turicatae]UPA15623.1 variable large family protein [Borrelia turicatae]
MKHRLSERIKNFNITILISLFLLFSCGSGQQPQAGKDGEAATGGKSLSEVLMEVGRSAENAFYSFLKLLSDTLGFTVTKDTKKSDVGGYFNSLGKKLGEVSKELEEVAKKSETGVDRDGSIVVVIRAAVEAAKITLSTLKGHLESLRGIGDDDKVGEATSNQNGVAASTDELKGAFKALKGIVETAGKEGVAKPKAGETAVKIGNADNKDGAKVLAAAANAGAAVGDKAAAIVSAVSGEEILASIVASQEGDAGAALAADATSDTSALKFAKGGNNAGQLAKEAAKAAAVAGGIALRSLVKDGKLAAHNNDDDKVVQAAGVTAVNKLLEAVEDIIKKTVKNVLEKVKKEVDKAREPKSVAQQ